MPLADVIALISLAFNILVAAVGLTWGIGRVRDAVRDEVEEHKLLMDGKVETLRRETGEMGTAIRTKVNEVELYVRDNFVRRDSFDRVISMISETIKAQLDKIDARLEKMETKLDSRPLV